jgi:hypothetical protein
MNVGLARRQAALAGVALAGALGAIALTRLDDGNQAPPPPALTVEWQVARVAVFEPSEEQTACGVTLTAESSGVAHPVLPCGARLVLEHEGRSAQAEVVERRPAGSGPEFDLTPALARQLGVDGRATVRWRFAG